MSSQRTNEEGSIRFKAQLEPLLIRKTNFAPQQEPVEGLSFHKYYHLKANSDPDIILQKNWVKPGKKRTFKVKLIDEDGSPIEGASFITDHAIGNHCGATTGFGATTNSDGIAKIQGNPATINAVYIRFRDQKMELSTEQLKQFLTDRDLTVHWKN